ncbi:trypsin-1 [Copidosoma floridanum]|uniref:trypsin-1 n=1 Tax=Copidosoma floridanum TaxID=29053 RepID=UPI0006C98622|nr:trypsin-1 [Copidosoma floridanum]
MFKNSLTCGVLTILLISMTVTARTAKNLEDDKLRALRQQFNNIASNMKCNRKSVKLFKSSDCWHVMPKYACSRKKQRRNLEYIRSVAMELESCNPSFTEHWERSRRRALRVAKKKHNHRELHFLASVHANIRRKRLIGGTDTTIEEHPYQVAIEYDREGSDCNGAITSKNYVLTAAHCVHNIAGGIKIRSGSSFREEGGTVHDVIDVIVPESYRTNEFDNTESDIGLARVNPPFSFSDTCRPIDINKEVVSSDYEPNVKPVLTGWGHVDHKYTKPHQLKALTIPWLSKRLCNALYRKFGGLYEGQICAGYVGMSHKNACPGDSGAPLVTNGVLVGIVIYGEGNCGLLDYPTVYTEVAYFHDWINTMMNSTLRQKRDYYAYN